MRKEVIKGSNDLLTVCPEAKECWNYKRNDMNPEDVYYNSSEIVWWCCRSGHEYQLSIKKFVNGDRCPYDSGKLPLRGFNDLATKYPELTKEWDYEKNAPLTPEDVTPFSFKSVWWKCPEGHSYLMDINSRSKGKNCPYCDGTMK